MLAYLSPGIVSSHMSPTDVYVNASGLLSYSVFAFFHSFRLCLGGALNFNPMLILGLRQCEHSLFFLYWSIRLLKNADLDDRRQPMFAIPIV